MQNFWQLHTLPILDESLKMRGIFMLDPKKEKWGFLRETEASAKKAGIDPDTGLFNNDFLPAKDTMLGLDSLFT
jgi:hypothetical protein